MTSLQKFNFDINFFIIFQSFFMRRKRDLPDSTIEIEKIFTHIRPSK